MLVDLVKHTSEMASWKLAYGFILYIILWIQCTVNLEDNRHVTFTILFLLSLIPSGNFALYYSKSLMKYRQHVKFLSIFYKKKIIFDTIKQRIDLLQFIENQRIGIKKRNRIKCPYFILILL